MGKPNTRRKICPSRSWSNTNTARTSGITQTTAVTGRRLNAWARASSLNRCRLRLKCDGTRAVTRFRLSAKRTSPFKSAGASVQSTTGSQGVRISGSNAGYTTFRGSVKSTGHPHHLPVSPSLPLPCLTVRHHISTGLYHCLCHMTSKVFLQHDGPVSILHLPSLLFAVA